MNSRVWFLTLILILVLVVASLAAWESYQIQPEAPGITSASQTFQEPDSEPGEAEALPVATPSKTSQGSTRQVTQVRYPAGDQVLTIEVLDDDLLHVELSGANEAKAGQVILTSPMVAKTDYPGPSQFQNDGKGTLETAEMKIQIDPETLCFTTTDTTREPDLIFSTFCPTKTPQKVYRLDWTQESFTDVYGLGEKFMEPGVMDGNWIGKKRIPGKYGNVQEKFQFGNVGSDQFPIAYFAGQGTDCYALFFDDAYTQFYDFTKQPWIASFRSPSLRFYLLTGPDFPDLRQDYLELTGHPPVPPKKAFGLWVSEFGYENWSELEDKLRTLRLNHFPVDGFVLDGQWYGGFQNDSDDTHVGSLRWDEKNFPDPEQKIAELRDEQGVGIIPIEQPYVGKNLPEHALMEKLGYLVKNCETCAATYLTENPWWGKGGMLDFTNPEGSAYWHDQRREPLIQAGVTGHWTDLGEPELYNPKAWYWGIPEGDQLLHNHPAVHNLYNLLWNRSIWEGYARNGEAARPFILSRSGTSGSQRYGVAQWSGDIGSHLDALASHLNVQMHMTMSGIDYYGSDIGGFFRYSGNPYMDDTYTQWFADGIAFDVPVRAHASNLQNQFETAPDRVGDLASNLENVRQRYALSPYLYSLAHRAYRFAEPVFPPLVYYYQADPNVRQMGGEKMIGRDLLVAAVAAYNQVLRQVYLPAGTWVDYRTGEWYESRGGNFGPFPLYPEGQFRLPMFARAGAILPHMWVDEQTMNITGRRLDGSVRDELILHVYADPTPSSFTLYEDDGQTMAYQKGEVRTTEITQQQAGDQVQVTVAAAQGDYTGAPEERDTLIWLYTHDIGKPSGVTLGGAELPRILSLAELYQAESGWNAAKPGLIVAKTGKQPVAGAKELTFTFQDQTESTPAPIQEPLPPADPTRGWQPVLPEQVGVDSDILAKAIDYIQERELNIHQMLMIRDGYQVLEATFARPNSSSQFDRLSITPPVLSTLVGIAIEQGLIDGVDQPLLEFFPDRRVKNLDERKKAITLKHLLTMTSGLNCEKFNQEISLAPLQGSQDWLQDLLDLPMAAAPGERFNYCPSDIHLVSAVLSAATGQNALEFARLNLFAPLGITSAEWAADPQGVSLGWRGLELDPADTAKLGYLYLHGGQWNGQQVISSDWVAAATKSQVPISNTASMGYLWLIDSEADQLFWFDHKGQTINLQPDRDLVQVYSGMLNDYFSNFNWILVSNFLFPAAVSEQPLPANPQGVSSLQAKITAAGQFHPQPVPPLPTTTDQISGKKYRLAENPSGWETVSLAFTSSDQAQLTLVVGGQEQVYPVGLDGLWRIPPEKETLPEAFYLAMRGRWEAENVFQLEYENVYRPGNGTARLTFTGDRLELAVEDRVSGKLVIQGEAE